MLKKSKFSVVDDIGSVYIGENRVFRVINPCAEKSVKKLICSGLIEELARQNLFPKTWLSDEKIDGNRLVLEHEKAGVITYPFEWSPEMMRRAALCVLKIIKISNEYGYELKDAHPYNILFCGCNPMWVDFGSIIPKKYENNPVALEQFFSSIYLPLKLYEAGLHSVYKKMWRVKGAGIPIEEYLLFKYSVLRILGINKLQFIVHAWFFLKRYLGYRSTNNLQLSKKKKIFLKLWTFLNLDIFFSNQKYVVEKIIWKVKKLQLTAKTAWSEYHKHSGLVLNDGQVILSERFNKILQIIDKLQPSTVTELAANQGVLSNEIAKRKYVKNVICTDYDEASIDRFMIHFGSNNKKIIPAVIDFMRCFHNDICEPPQNRLKSELVIALAVTHHLILTQKYELNFIFERIFSFGEKYVITEFMPLGLWNGKFSPEIPIWYTQEWFEGNLKNQCKIIESTQYEKNRILYVCRKLGVKSVM